QSRLASVAGANLTSAALARSTLTDCPPSRTGTASRPDTAPSISLPSRSRTLGPGWNRRRGTSLSFTSRSAPFTVRSVRAEFREAFSTRADSRNGRGPAGDGSGTAVARYLPSAAAFMRNVRSLPPRAGVRVRSTVKESLEGRIGTTRASNDTDLYRLVASRG